MGRPEDKEKHSLRRRNKLARDMRQNKLFHEKVQYKPSDRPQKISPYNYEEFIEDEVDTYDYIELDLGDWRDIDDD